MVEVVEVVGDGRIWHGRRVEDNQELRLTRMPSSSGWLRDMVFQAVHTAIESLKDR